MKHIFLPTNKCYWNPQTGKEEIKSINDLALIQSPGQFKYEEILGAIARTLLDSEEENIEKLTFELCEKIGAKYETRN